MITNLRSVTARLPTLSAAVSGQVAVVTGTKLYRSIACTTCDWWIAGHVTPELGPGWWVAAKLYRSISSDQHKGGTRPSRNWDICCRLFLWYQHHIQMGQCGWILTLCVDSMLEDTSMHVLFEMFSHYLGMNLWFLLFSTIQNCGTTSSAKRLPKSSNAMYLNYKWNFTDYLNLLCHKQPSVVVSGSLAPRVMFFLGELKSALRDSFSI